MKRVAAPLAAALLASAALLVLAACGGSGAEPGASNEATPATLVLDFQPNAVHAGIYRAPLYAPSDVLDLKIREPSTSTDAPKLLESGRAQFAIMDIHDLGLAAEKGFDLVGLLPIVQRPLASVLAQPTITRPRELEGRRVGVTGLPSDDAVLDSVVTADGGDPSKVDRVTIGFNAVSALAAGKVDAATGFWNAEGVTLKENGVPINEFRVDDYGAPRYPELFLVTTRTELAEHPDLVAAAVMSVGLGYSKMQMLSPGAALKPLLDAVPGLDPVEQRAEYDALFNARAYFPVNFNRATLQQWASWDVEHGILSRPPKVDTLFDLGLG